MDISWFLYSFPFVLAFLLVIHKIKLKKRREQEYFHRMYWTMRQAQEDANKNKDKHD